MIKVDFPQITEICELLAAKPQEAPEAVKLLVSALRDKDAPVRKKLKALTITNEMLYDERAVLCFREAPSLPAALATLRVLQDSGLSEYVDENIRMLATEIDKVCFSEAGGAPGHASRLRGLGSALRNNLEAVSDKFRRPAVDEGGKPIPENTFFFDERHQRWRQRGVPDGLDDAAPAPSPGAPAAPTGTGSSAPAAAAKESVSSQPSASAPFAAPAPPPGVPAAPFQETGAASQPTFPGTSAMFAATAPVAEPCSGDSQSSTSAPFAAPPAAAAVPFGAGGSQPSASGLFAASAAPAAPWAPAATAPGPSPAEPFNSPPSATSPFGAPAGPSEPVEEPFSSPPSATSPFGAPAGPSKPVEAAEVLNKPFSDGPATSQAGVGMPGAAPAPSAAPSSASQPSRKQPEPSEAEKFLLQFAKRPKQAASAQGTAPVAATTASPSPFELSAKADPPSASAAEAAPAACPNGGPAPWDAPGPQPGPPEPPLLPAAPKDQPNGASGPAAASPGTGAAGAPLAPVGVPLPPAGLMGPPPGTGAAGVSLAPVGVPLPAGLMGPPPGPSAPFPAANGPSASAGPSPLGSWPGSSAPAATQPIDLSASFGGAAEDFFIAGAEPSKPAASPTVVEAPTAKGASPFAAPPPASGKSEGVAALFD
ncbi:unnamed protein product [Symbiodinium natans]|uniref:ENTH domain-containing protein n=1 Tax=Symbiodinium natans TaxID=878477 RepID=A0A812MCH2_9DINO|nr:unnamed protein product [Symbiodinium natans]